MQTSLRRAALAVVAVLAVCLVWTAVVLLVVRGDLTAARETLVALREDADVDELGPELAEVEERLERSARLMGQPGPRVASYLPLLGRTPTAVREAAAGAADVVASTRTVLDAVPEDLLADGRVDLAGLQALQVATAEAGVRTRSRAERLAGVDTGATPGVVADGVVELRAEVRGAADGFARSASALEAVRGVLGGDRERRVLLALQNNAELRGTGGIVTVFAEATAKDGRLELEAFRDVEDVADKAGQARPVDVPADFNRLYGRFRAGTTLWKNANMSPDVPTSSRVLTEVAGTTLSRRPDVVVWFDVPLIAAVLRALGRAELPDGSTLDGGNAVRRLLSDAYREVPDTPRGQQVRRAQLRAAADVVVSRLLGRDGAPEGGTTTLARELGAAAAGRHLALWSADADEQAALSRAGIDGAVRADGGDLSALTVHNLGGGGPDGNKLDYYARRQTTVAVQVGRRSALVEQTVQVRNTAPASGLPRYVAGRGTPGVSNSFVTLSLPTDAAQVRFSREGRRLRVDPLPEADHDVLTDVVSTPPGATVTWRLSYRLPLRAGAYRALLVPQPLAVDSGLEVDVRAVDGLVLRSDDGSTGAVHLSQPFAELTRVSVVAEEPGALSRAREQLRRFWSEPVRLR